MMNHELEKLRRVDYPVLLKRNDEGLYRLAITRLGLRTSFHSSLDAAWAELEAQKDSYYRDMIDMNAVGEIPDPRNGGIQAMDPWSRFWIQTLVRSAISLTIILVGVLILTTAMDSRSKRFVADLKGLTAETTQTDLFRQNDFRRFLERIKPYYRDLRTFLHEEEKPKKEAEGNGGSSSR